MEYIFDQQRPLPGGVVKGGAGKMAMYGSKELELCGVKFACKPFNELFWSLWKLFAEYLNQVRYALQRGDPGEHPMKISISMKTWTLTQAQSRRCHHRR